MKCNFNAQVYSFVKVSNRTSVLNRYLTTALKVACKQNRMSYFAGGCEKLNIIPSILSKLTFELATLHVLFFKGRTSTMP